MTEFSFADLFAGIGGFRLALEPAGGHSIGFSEIATDAINVYCDNFHDSSANNFGDITKLSSIPQHDFMTAGVPCQSWSAAGRKLGFDDDRGQLWNDAIFLLNKVRPKAFIFENVKGLADPRNKESLDYILNRISQSGYNAKTFLLNASDYGVAQNRIRLYIVGFRDKQYYDRFILPKPYPSPTLNNITDNATGQSVADCDYFIFNDLRGGYSSIHSWDIIQTTEKEKHICQLILSNRRKKKYGILDGNAMSPSHIQQLDDSVTPDELEQLIDKKILKHKQYRYEICGDVFGLSENERFLLSHNLIVDELKQNKEIRKLKINVERMLKQLEAGGVVRCTEMRYDFQNTKISTGINGIYRIFLPSAKAYPTLVASDTNDFIATENIKGNSADEWKHNFINDIFKAEKFRKITKSEACRIQGFPSDFRLPDKRPKWMHLIGNSVAVPVVSMLVNSVVKTGVFKVA